MDSSVIGHAVAIQRVSRLCSFDFRLGGAAEVDFFNGDGAGFRGHDGGRCRRLSDGAGFTAQVGAQFVFAVELIGQLQFHVISSGLSLCLTRCDNKG